MFPPLVWSRFFEPSDKDAQGGSKVEHRILNDVTRMAEAVRDEGQVDAQRFPWRGTTGKSRCSNC